MHAGCVCGAAMCEGGTGVEEATGHVHVWNTQAWDGTAVREAAQGFVLRGEWWGWESNILGN